ncbi:MAG: hypothetical protein RIT45_2129 [Pseudomonadota bacterium]
MSTPTPTPPPDPVAEAARWQARTHKLLLGFALGAASMWLVWRLRIVTAPLVVGFLLAWALNPAVRWLRRLRVPALVALMVPLAVVIGLGVVTLAIIVPVLGTELMRVSAALPGRVRTALLHLDPFFERVVGRPVTEMVAPEALLKALQGELRELAGPATSMVSWLLESAGTVLLAIGNVGLVFVVTAFLIDDYRQILRFFDDLVPPRARPTVRRIAGRIDETLMGFVRGELLLFILASMSFTAGLMVLEVPFAALIGPVAGALYLVPYLGVVTGAAIALLLALPEAPSWATFAGVTSVFAVFYGVDLLFVTPRLIGGRVGLQPIVVLLGIIAGGELLGIAGIVLAVPFLAVVRILLIESIDAYRRTAAFSEAVPEAAEAAGDPIPAQLPAEASPENESAP